MITRRRVLLAVLLLFLASVAYVAWTLAGLPPVKYHLRYGLDPYCEPTGETVTYEGVTFVEISPGVFQMGTDHLVEGGDWLGKICAPLGLPWGARQGLSDGMPAHWVEFRRGFWIATTEVTNAQYERFRPGNQRSAASKGDHTPIDQISWEDAKKYCTWISEKSGRSVRLPSEAEWECALRAGSDGELSISGDEEGLSAHARKAEDPPNRWGLSGFHGNVWEWCEDTYHKTYEGAPHDGSPWADEGSPVRVVRGGSPDDPARNFRSAFPYRDPPTFRYGLLGFRLAFVVPDQT